MKMRTPAWVLVLGLSAGTVATGQQATLGGLSHPCQSGPNVTACGDMNGDGLIDVVMGHNPGILSVTRNLGNGAFDTGTVLLDLGQLPGGTFSELALADLDGDGDLDILALPLAAIRNDGSGGFAGLEALPFPPGTHSSLSAPTDLNADGHLDLASLMWPTGALTSQLVVLLGQGNGSFGALAGVDNDGVLGNIDAVADVNGDGIPDLVGGGFGVAGLRGVIWKPGQGDGTFGAATLGYPSSSNLFGIAIADMDSDGDGDVSVYSQGSLLILANDGSGSFSLRSAQPVPQAILFEIKQQLLQGDFNGDGAIDILLNTLSASGGAVFAGDGQGNLSAAAAYLPPSLSVFASVFDMNSDGMDDLVVPLYFTDELAVLYGADTPFVNAGFGGGTQILTGAGNTTAGALVSLRVDGPTPGAAGLLAVSSQTQPTPFAGGVLVPASAALVAISVGADLIARWPQGLTDGSSLYAQAIVASPSGPELSNLLAIVDR